MAGITQILTRPDQSLVNADKTGFIYTQIIRSGDQLKTGANGYTGTVTLAPTVRTVTVQLRHPTG